MDPGVIILPTLTAAVKMIGAVSPAARPMLITTPVRIPGIAAGRMIVMMVRQRLAPSASAPSRYERGTEASAMLGEALPPGPRDASNDAPNTNIVGIDGTPAGLAAVKEGKMLGTVVIDYAAQAKLIFDMASALAADKDPREIINIGADRTVRAPMYVVKADFIP